MAGFCTKCGSALADGNSFCTGCGAPIPGTGATGPAASGPSGPVASTAGSAPAAAPAVQPAAAPQGASALKVILIVLGVFVGLCILGGMAISFGLWRLSRNVRVDQRSGQVSISTPGGKMTMGPGAEVTEAELGVPLYPGAKRAEGSFQLSSEEGSMATYVFKTSDSPAQVMAFYRGKVSPKSAIVETPEGGVITSEGGANVGFMITIGHEESTGQTSIAIMRGTSKKAQ
jgi:zinc ribbon protein